MFKKKNNLQTAIAIACMSASLSSYAALPAKPNVVTIMIDDMGFSDIGRFGGEIDTPNLDSLIQNGTQLTNYYSAATSSPARSMFFTGRDNHAAGFGNMAGLAKDRPPQKGMPGYEGVLTKTLPTFPQLLQTNPNSSYYTAMVGKWHLGEGPGLYPSDRGFTDALALLPGGDIQFLSDANGKIISSFPLKVPGAVSPSWHTNPGQPDDVATPYNKNGKPYATFPPNAFSTDFYTDEALKLVENRPDKTKPFYMHISHIASHGPFQAPDNLIQKYLPVYSQGLDVLRAARFAKLKALGLVAPDAVLPPLPPEVKPWSKLTASQQKIEAKRMAVYAGMVEKLDQSVGEVINRIKAMGPGVYENTVFFVMSDNGGALHEPEDPVLSAYLDANFSRDTTAGLANMGSSTSYISPSGYTGTLSNMPYNRYKAETFDGGVHTAAFMFSPVSDPASRGAKYDCLTSVMDMSATILDITGTAYPKIHNGYPIAPMDGKSLAQVFAGDLTCKTPNRTLGFELNGGKMLIKGDMKLSQKWLTRLARWDDNMYLFNIATDPFELNNLSKKSPTVYRNMWAGYTAYALKNRVVDVGPRIFAGNADLKMVDAASVPTVGGMILGGTQVDHALNNHVPVLPQTVPFAWAAPKMGQTVDIAAEIYPPLAHRGTAGNVMVAAYYKPTTGAGQWTTFRRARNTVGKVVSSVEPLADAADGSVAAPDFSKVPAFSAPLASFSGRIELPIYEGKLINTTAAGNPSFAAGTYYFWVGYQLSTGVMERSASPITLNVAP
jgi:arylsulfatase A-like enzyme